MADPQVPQQIPDLGPEWEVVTDESGATRARNKKTGEELILEAGQWKPVQAGELLGGAAGGAAAGAPRRSTASLMFGS
jgi:hypothetical protein